MEFLSFDIESNDFRRGGAASRAIKERLKRIGAEAEAVRRAMIAAYEAEMNVVIHSVGGRLEAALSESRLDVNVIDEGPGIPDVELAMTEGYSTAGPEARALGFGAGMGLPNIKRSSDRLRITSRPGEGTRVSFTIFLRPEAQSGQEPGKPTLSLYASADRCRECRACLTACPTQALRVRNGAPTLLDHLCIDCTECIAVCTSQALGIAPDCTSVADLGALEKTTLVVPAALLAGCGPGYSPEQVLRALYGLGFAEVIVVEAFLEALRHQRLGTAETPRRPDQEPDEGAEVTPLPLILPTCPAVTNLLELRFPSLLPALAPFVSPWEAVVAKWIDASAEGRLAFVVSCPAQRSVVLEQINRHGRAMTASPTGTVTQAEAGDSAVSSFWSVEFLTPEAMQQAVLGLLTGALTGARVEAGSDGSPGASRTAQPTRPPATIGSESAPAPPGAEPSASLGPLGVDGQGLPSVGGQGLLRVCGIRHVRAVLEQIEDGLLPEVTLLEPYACAGGCFGSPLLALDHHVSRYRWQRFLADAGSLLEATRGPTGPAALPPAVVERTHPPSPRLGIRLDPHMGRAIRKLGQLQALIHSLPGKDCGVCGAPTCAALAEDIVMGRANQASCPYLTSDREDVDP